MEIIMYFSEFERIIMTAADAAYYPQEEPTKTAELAARYAARVGWHDGPGCSTRRPSRLSISGSDGVLTVAPAIGPTITVPVGSHHDVLDGLVLLKILPSVFSTPADQALLDLAEAHERVADHVSGSGVPDGLGLAQIWQAAADSARDYRLLRMRELAHGITSAAPKAAV
jgi:hypothetical protein